LEIVSPEFIFIFAANKRQSAPEKHSHAQPRRARLPLSGAARSNLLKESLEQTVPEQPLCFVMSQAR
jgi:hypothetical protein